MTNSTRWQVLWFRLNTQLFIGLASSETTHQVKVFTALKPSHFGEVKGVVTMPDIGAYYACRPAQVPALIRCKVRAYLFDNTYECKCDDCIRSGRIADYTAGYPF